MTMMLTNIIFVPYANIVCTLVVHVCIILKKLLNIVVINVKHFSKNYLNNNYSTPFKKMQILNFYKLLTYFYVY